MSKITAAFIACMLIAAHGVMAADESVGALNHLKKGEEYFQNQNYEKALYEFKQSVKLDPGLLKGWENLGWTYWKLENVDEAIEVWKNVRQITPDDTRMINALAKAYTAKGNFDEALSLYEKSLQLDPSQKEIRFYRARLLGWNRHREEAVGELRKLFDEDKFNDKVRFQLAKFLSEENNHAEALPHWEALVRQYPDESKYRLELYKSLYLLEKYEDADKTLRDVLKRDPENIRALEFQADNAVYTGEYEKAERVFKRIILKDPSSMRALNKLLKISFELHDYPSAIRAAQKSLKLDDDASIRLLYADALRLKGDLKEAEKQYQEVLKRNPNNFPAHIGLKELYLESRLYDKALEQIDLLLDNDPSNFYLQVDKAEAWAYQKKFDASINLLRELERKAAENPSVFILLYHGLSPLERTDIFRLSHFKDQMHALHEMGYVDITVEDIAMAWAGKKQLPEKTVLITFDDARRDSFQFADPVLQELNYQAVMLVPISIINKKNPFFCSWDQILKYQETGRWSIQAHGYLSHEPIPVGKKEESLFLPNKLWIAKEKRLESEGEFRKRIDRDDELAKEELEKLIGRPVSAFSYPEGNIGQEGYSNYQGAVKDNLAAAGKHFKTSYMQDRFGFNLVGDYPYLLKRTEIPKTWTREQFEQHLLLQRPLWKVKIFLAEVLRWAGRLDESSKLYDELEKEFPNQERVLLGRGALYMQSSDFEKAGAVFQDVLNLNPGSQEAQEKLHQIKKELRPNAESSFSYFEDSNDRRVMRWQILSDVFLKGGHWTLTPSYDRALLEEEGIEDIDENRFGLAGAYQRQLQTFRASYALRDYSGADDAHNYGLEFMTPFSFIDRFQLFHFYENVQTAKAVQAGVSDFRYGLGFDENLPHHLSLSGKYQFFDYDDDNERNSARLGLFYQFHEEPDLWVGYEFDYENTDFDSDNYYAPDSLFIHQVRIRARGRVLDSKLYYDLSYALGRASEENTDDRWVNSALVSLQYQINDRFILFGAGNFSKTPSYDSQYIQGGIRIDF